MDKQKLIDDLKLLRKERVDRYETFLTENGYIPSTRKFKKYKKRDEELLQRIFDVEDLIDRVERGV